MGTTSYSDLQIRNSAFSWLNEKKAIYGAILEWKLLQEGFVFNGNKISLLGMPGIWKPSACNFPLSIRTSVKGQYPDTSSEDNSFIQYSYRGTDPIHPDNVGLREAMRNNIPLIYFKGVSAGRYSSIYPVFIYMDRPLELSCFLQAGIPGEINNSAFDSQFDQARSYYTREVLQREHQKGFRDKVTRAYNCQCAFCRIKHLKLLDAAHIIGDKEELGQPVVVNGLSLCKIHHAAFDANFMGVTPDYQIKVAHKLLDEIDGPMLQHGIKELHNTPLWVPERRNLRPDKARLEIRYEEFRKAV